MTPNQVYDLQRALKAKGFNPGPIDGVRGRLTDAAVVAFKQSVGLRARPYVGPVTMRALGLLTHAKDKGAEVADTPWYGEALRLKGTREISGKRHNQTIMRWAQQLGGAIRRVYTADEIPWCGLFTAHCVATALPTEALPSNPLGARNWLKFGCAVSPTKGAVLVFWRGKRSGWTGHVGFYAGEDETHYHVLGGNQSNAVTITRIAKRRLLGSRWPNSAPMTSGGPTFMAARGAVSTNEA